MKVIHVDFLAKSLECRDLRTLKGIRDSLNYLMREAERIGESDLADHIAISAMSCEELVELREEESQNKTLSDRQFCS